MKARVSPAKAKAKAKAAATAAAKRSSADGGSSRKRSAAGRPPRAAPPPPAAAVDAAGRPLVPFLIGGRPTWKARVWPEDIKDWIDLDALRPGDELRAAVLPSAPPPPPLSSDAAAAAAAAAEATTTDVAAAASAAAASGDDDGAADGDAAGGPPPATGVPPTGGDPPPTARHDAHAVYLSVPVYRHGRRGTTVPVHARLRHTPPGAARRAGGGLPQPGAPAAAAGDALEPATPTTTAAAAAAAVARVPSDVATPGRPLRVVVTSVQPAAGRLEVVRARDAARASSMAARRGRDGGALPALPSTTPLAALCVGDALPPASVVVGVSPKGVRVDAGVWRPGKATRGGGGAGGGGADGAAADTDRAVVPVFGYLTRRRFPPRVASTADASVRDDAVAVWGVGDALGPAPPVYVRGVHPASGLLFLDGAPVDAGRVAAERRARKALLARWRRRKAAEDKLTVGASVVGVVKSLTRYGAFVDVGVRRELLVHWTRMGERHKRDWRQALPVGTEVVVTVTGVGGRGENAAALVATAAEAEADAAAAAAAAASPTAVATRRAPTPTPLRLWDTPASRAAAAPAVGTAAPQQAGDGEEGEEEEEEEEDSDEEDGSLDRFDDAYFEDKYG